MRTSPALWLHAWRGEFAQKGLAGQVVQSYQGLFGCVFCLGGSPKNGSGFSVLEVASKKDEPALSTLATNLHGVPGMLTSRSQDQLAEFILMERVRWGESHCQLSVWGGAGAKERASFQFRGSSKRSTDKTGPAEVVPIHEPRDSLKGTHQLDGS